MSSARGAPLFITPSEAVLRELEERVPGTDWREYFRVREEAWAAATAGQARWSGRSMVPPRRSRRRRGPVDPVRVSVGFDVRRIAEYLNASSGPGDWRHEFPRGRLRVDPCAYCGGRGGVLDHIDPRARGGGDRVQDDNLTGACPGCNTAKGATPLLLHLAHRAHAGRPLGVPFRHQVDPRPRPDLRKRRDAVAVIRALNDRDLSAGGFRVLALLGMYADGAGWCWPDLGALGERMHATRSRISKRISELERCGYLRIHYEVSGGARRLVLQLTLSADELAELQRLPSQLQSN